MSNQAPTTERRAGSRRAFLEQPAASIVAGALAAGLSIARSAHAAGDDTIKIALIGCGGRGTGAANNALRTKGNVKLDRDGRRLRRSAGREPQRSEGREARSDRRPQGAAIRRFRCLSKGDRCRSRPGDPGHASRFSPDPFRSRRQGRQTRLHGKAGGRRPGRRAERAGLGRGGTQEEAGGRRRPGAPASRQLSGSDAADPRRRHRRHGLPARLLEQRRPWIHAPRSGRFRNDLPDAQLVVLQLARRRSDRSKSTST